MDHSEPLTVITSSNVKPFLGSRSLQIAMGVIDENGNQEYSPVTKVYVASPAIESTSQSVTLNLWIPSNAVIDSINPFIADRAGIFWRARGHRLTRPILGILSSFKFPQAQTLPT